MHSEILDAAHVAHGTSAQTNPDTRNPTLNSFILSNYGSLTCAAYDAHPGLLAWDAERLICLLASDLSRYGGPPVESDFLLWAERFVRREAERFKITATILREHGEFLTACIRKYRWESATDCAIGNDDLLNEIAYLIHNRAHSLNRRGDAKITTRLVGLVKKHIFLTYNSRNRRRIKAVRKHIDANGKLHCECFSDEERASMKVSTQSYDSGYAECGLLLG